MADPVRSARNATTDDERAEAILQSISQETLQVYDMLRDGLVEEASLKTFEVNIVHDMVKDTIATVRGEAYSGAAESARSFARNCSAAAAQFPGTHHRTMIKMVGDLFEQFAQAMDGRATENGASATVSSSTSSSPVDSRPAIDEVGDAPDAADETSASDGEAVVQLNQPRGMDRRG